MKLLYTSSIHLYRLAVGLASPFNKKAALWISGRKNLLESLNEKMGSNTQPTAWFHAASLGEFEQARPVIEAFKASNPTYKIVVSFFSPSGYEIRKNYQGADIVTYLPLDTENNARAFIDILNPTLVFFVKYEFWYYHLAELKRRNIPTFLFSAIFRKEQPFFSKYTAFYKNILSSFSYLFVQDTTSTVLLASINVLNSEAIGDTRFDRVKQLVEAKKEFPIIPKFKENSLLFIVGSAWNKDMEILLPCFNSEAFNSVKIIVAPHEIHTEEIKEWRSKFNGSSILYSEATEANCSDKRLLIIDSIGILSSLYQYGDIAWIGGAFGKGLHNILEAATYGMPIYFGPRYQKFKEAKDLVKIGSAITVTDQKTFLDSFLQIKNDLAKRIGLSDQSKKYVVENTGATEKILHHLRTNYPTLVK